MKIIRTKQTAYATYGRLEDDDGNIVVPATLEPPNPVDPGGPFEYYRYSSPHFGTDVFRCDEIPGHIAIELHFGNFAADTEDCCLLGLAHGMLFDHHTGQDELCVLDSRKAFDLFMEKMKYQNTFQMTIVDQTGAVA